MPLKSAVADTLSFTEPVKDMHAVPLGKASVAPIYLPQQRRC